MLFTSNQFEKLRKQTFENLYHDLQNREGPNLTDVTIVSEDLKTVEAHRVILSTASPVLASLVISHSQVGSRTVLFLSGVPQKHIEGLVSYIYHGTAEVVEEEQFIMLLEQFQIIGHRKSQHKGTFKWENNINRIDSWCESENKEENILQSENRNVCTIESNARFGPNEIVESKSFNLKTLEQDNILPQMIDGSLPIYL